MIQFGAHKLPLSPDHTREERITHTTGMLCRSLNMRTTVAVVGSGCTIPLGYPRWQDMARELVKQALEWLASQDGKNVEQELDRFHGFKESLASTAKPTSESITACISACQRLALNAKGSDAENPYYDYIQRRFAEGRCEDAPNICQALVKLPIDRFVTTNFDREIEKALFRDKERNLKSYVDPSQLGLKRRKSTPPSVALSFTQLERYACQHIRFAIARGRGSSNMVFHCHGCFDDPESIIASEADYQRWYVTEKTGFAFRQTMDLLFSSNPLLFVGYGMRDPDLLHPLRRLGAVDPERKHSRSVFAILPEQEAKDVGETLFERYGLHVIPFKETPEAAAGEPGKALYEAIEQLYKDWNESRDEWVQKPAVRSPKPSVPSPNQPYYMPDFAKSSLDERLAPSPARRQKQEEIVNAIGEARVVGLIGAGGTGKSQLALEVIDRLATTPVPGESTARFDEIIYWNADYSNEAVTALDLALAYLDPHREWTGSRESRLAQCLDGERRILLVIDGCERLLRPTERPAEGRAFGAAFRQILGIMESCQSKSTLVLVGQLWPSELGSLWEDDRSDSPLHKQKRTKVFWSERLGVKDLMKVDPFARLPRGHVSSLASLLAGHSYGLLLAARYLNRSHSRERSKKLQRLLAERPPHKRLDALIAETLREIGKDGSESLELLERLALFTEPVFRPTLDTCYREACGKRSKPKALDPMIDRLESNCVLVKVNGVTQGDYGVAVQVSVRNYLRGRGRMPGTAVSPDFSLTGFTAGTNGVDPGSKERQGRLDSLFEALCTEAESAKIPATQEGARALCRDAYGLLRTQFDSSTAARWRSYDRYMRHGIRLTGLVKELGKPLWAFCEPREIESTYGRRGRGSLYIGELAWLYNDVGLALFCEGQMQDAYSVWEQGYEINQVLEGTQPYGEFVVESLLNLTHVFIELGKVTDAREYLDKAARLNVRLRDGEFRGRILGYQGLCEQIGGNLQRADELYDECERCLRIGDNRRAMSYFLSFQAGIKIELGAFAETQKIIQSSRALAEAGDHPDLVTYSRLAEADLLAAQCESARARQVYLTALAEAQKHGARAVEAIVYLKLGNLSLEQEDAEGARRFAIQSLKLANELALGLLVTRALLTLARAMLPVRRQLGISYLEIVKQRAREQGYGMRLREAEKYLHNAGAIE